MLQIRIVTIISIFLFLTSTSSYAQITQTIRGRVFNAETQKPLVEAAIILNNEEVKTVTNTEGVFRFEKIAVGRHILRVSFVGFETLIVPDILLESGKEMVLDITLKPLNISTETLVVTDRRTQYFDPINGIRNERLSRYPATFNDPARLLTYLPGAATTNDQGNNISVRGTSPNMVQWYLEGAEVVNPNHLSNAGTRSDQATVNGGGVLIPGFNVMAGMQFYKGSMSADRGGALTSIMDIGLRKGNNERRESQVSIGLVGTELGTEGAFSKKSKASYLVHYRYSTIGLLAKMGVPLGDEEIQFQDLSVNLNFPTAKAGTFNVFGIYGTSENLFTHLPNRTDWKIDKDSQDITFTNKMGAIGVRHELSIGRGHLSTVVAYSALENERSAVGFSLNNVPFIVQSAKNQPSKLFFKTVYNYVLNDKQNLKMAFVARKDDFQYSQTLKIGQTNTIVPASQSSWWLQPSLAWQGRWTANWSTDIGVRLVQWNNLTNNKQNQTNFEPTANVQYLFSNSSNLTLGYSLQSQMVSPQFAIPSDFNSANGIDFENITKSHNINLGYRFKLSKNLLANIEAYYQSIFKASFLTLNAYDVSSSIFFNDITEGRNAGVEIDIQQQLNKGFYWRANVSIFDAKYKSRTQWINNQFNGHYISNVLVGKEWEMGSLKNKFLGVGFHTILRGGYYDSYSQQNLKDYFRTDLNVYWKRSHKRYSSTVQLDLQNVSNQQNEGWRYYDRRQGRAVTQYQLGLIPNLAYKVEF